MSVLTKKALVSAFGAVLARKSLGKMTVSDITDECGLSRMTFYYHFKDVYDLIEWALEDRLERLLSDSAAEAWKKNYLKVFEFALEHRAVVLKLLPDMEQKYIRKYLRGLAFKMSMDVIEEKAEGRQVEDEDKRFMANVYSFALVETLLEWAYSGMKEAPELMVRRVGAMFDGNAATSFENLAALRVSKDNQN